MLKELFRLEDEQGLIIVTEQADKRSLQFASGLQQSSVYMNKTYYPVYEYTQIMLLGLLFTDAKNIILLGLGGGGLLHCVNHYYPNSLIQAVEIRQAVIDIAYEWFALPVTKNVQVVCADASEFIHLEKTQTKDVIFSDLYEAQTMSEIQGQADFIVECYKVLSDKGWLVINFHSKPEEDSPLMREIKKLFSDVLVCDVYKGNWVVFCGKASSFFEQHDLKQRVKALTKKTEIPLMYYFKQLRKI